ncbi:MAG: DUF2147 domain-containing protein [Beijerinckiaceae bacterium]|nr:DUF2147 domain-containing protein [Beijerinckiaceae bacterium]
MARTIPSSRLKTTLLALGAAAIGALALPGAASAQEVLGTWLRENGESRIRLAKCGDAICGTVVWLKNPAESKSKVGQRVFYDMKPNGSNSWAGQAFNPEDGKTYSGKMTLSGNSLTTAGCVAGGWICRSVSWARAN